MYRQSIEKEIKFYYLYHLFSNLDFARGIFVIYIIGKGISGAQVGMIQSILFVSTMIFEVPTGFIADKYSKKLSIALGVLVYSIAPICIYLSASFVHFALSFIFLGIGYSLTSGADTAILYNHLENGGDTWLNKYKLIIGRATSYRYIALAIAISLGGILQSFGWKYVFFSTSFGGILAVISVIFMSEPKEKTHFSEVESHKTTTLKDLVKFIKSDGGQNIFYLMVSIGLIQGAVTPLFIYSQLMFNNAEMSNQVIGIIIASGLLVSSFSYSQAYRVKVNNFMKFLLKISGIIFVVMTSFMFISNNYLLIIFYLMAQAIIPILGVHFSYLLNGEIPSKVRATCLSLQSLIGSVILCISNVLFGGLVDNLSVKVAFGFIGVMPLLSLIFFIIYFKRKNAAYF